MDMARSKKFRDSGEWYRERVVIYEIEIEKGNKIRFSDDRHVDSESERTFWHGIKIQRISKSLKGKWMYREKLNIPYKKFLDFCKIVMEVNEKIAKTKNKRHRQVKTGLRSPRLGNLKA